MLRGVIGHAKRLAHRVASPLLSTSQKRLNVNIADHEEGIRVNYTTPGELRKYTKSTRRFFSREEAKSRGLAALLKGM